MENKFYSHCLPRFSVMIVVLIATSSISAQPEHAREGRDRHSPVYQRRAFEWMDGARHPHKRGRFHPPSVIAPPVSSGWFQRPYPYHLDYYKMRYGGSYAPYFGNLYGPPQIVTAPPYYGPYYGEYATGLPGSHPVDDVRSHAPSSESLPSP